MLVAKFYRRLLILACLQTHQESNGTCNAVSNNAMSSLVEIVYRLAAGARNLLFVKRLRKACSSEPHFEVPSLLFGSSLALSAQKLGCHTRKVDSL